MGKKYWYHVYRVYFHASRWQALRAAIALQGMPADLQWEV